MVEPHPTDLWREDFAAADFERWVLQFLTHRSTAWERGDLDAFATFVADDYVQVSLRTLVRGYAEGRHAVEEGWTHHDFFPCHRTGEVTVFPPNRFIARTTMHDGGGNEVSAWAAFRVRRGLLERQVAFDERHEAVAALDDLDAFDSDSGIL